MAKKNQVAKVKNLDCLNCGYPFFGNEVYCPECGQKNKNERINFGGFIKEVFNGFFSWDAKFWRTLLPLLTKPGKVSKDYIDGKRARYTNPFRFYLTTSIVFFLILGAGQRYNDFKSLNNEKANSVNIVNINTSNNEINRDSLKQELYKNIDAINIDSIIVAEKKKDSVKTTTSLNGLDGLKKFNSFIKFAYKNPTMDTNKALDSLKIEKTFNNRFWYSRARLANELFSSKESVDKFNKEIISYFSIALFILLPIFTLFLKFFYIRGKKTYVEHLIFTFHTQTLFFILLTIFYLIGIFSGLEIGKLGPVFSILFGLYLFLAMWKFYQQGKFKTFIKFCLANITFMILLSFGTLIISAIAFALY